MVLPSRRKQFKFVMTPTDNELWAIGAIAVQWSQLEAFITAFVHALLDDKSAREIFDTTRAVDQRLNQWQAAVEREILPEFQPKILAVIRKVKNAKFLRDRVMHGTWTGDHVEAPEDIRNSAVFNWGPRKPYQWDLDFGKLIKLALLIDSCIAEIAIDIGRFGAKPEEFVTLGDSLQRIRHTPRPPETPAPQPLP
jgi:hypothetical protein